MNSLPPQGASLPYLIKTAIQHQNDGHFLEAESVYKKIITIKSDSAEIYKNLGNTLLCLERFEEAERAYRQALAINPEYPEAYNNLGNVLRLVKRLEEAEIAFLKSLALMPDSADIHSNFGNVLMDFGRIEEAEQEFRKAIVHNPDYVLAYNNRGNALRLLGRLEASEKSYRQAIALKPDYADAFCGLGNVLQEKSCLEDAVNSFRQAIALKPDYSEVYSNLGNVLFCLGRYFEAEQAHRDSIKLKPNNAEAYSNLGFVLQNQGRLEEAEQAYLHAIDIKPDYATAQYNLSLLYLLQGKFEKGLKLHEQRFCIRSGIIFDKANNQLMLQLQDYKRWEGEPLNGLSLLVTTEQGAGDNLMMMRYLTLCKQRGLKRLVIYCEHNLKRVFQTITAVDEVVSVNESVSIDRVDFYCSMMSLPYIFQTRLETIPYSVPYLFIPDNLNKRKILKNVQGTKVGLVWAGNKLNKNNLTRSILLRQFSHLLKIDGVKLISLQKGEDASQLKDLGWDILDGVETCEDLLDTATLINQLDLVISVDTSVAHLAGALGMPVWLLNRYESEWRWLLHREDSPWYPSMRIFRQKERGNWDAVIRLVADELKKISINNRKLI